MMNDIFALIPLPTSAPFISSSLLSVLKDTSGNHVFDRTGGVARACRWWNSKPTRWWPSPRSSTPVLRPATQTCPEPMQSSSRGGWSWSSGWIWTFRRSRCPGRRAGPSAARASVSCCPRPRYQRIGAFGRSIDAGGDIRASESPTASRDGRWRAGAPFRRIDPRP